MFFLALGLPLTACPSIFGRVFSRTLFGILPLACEFPFRISNLSQLTRRSEFSALHVGLSWISTGRLSQLARKGQSPVSRYAGLSCQACQEPIKEPGSRKHLPSTLKHLVDIHDLTDVADKAAKDLAIILRLSSCPSPPAQAEQPLVLGLFNVFSCLRRNC